MFIDILQKTVMSHPQMVKALCPGRVIDTDDTLGVVLQSGRGSTYTVLTVGGQHVTIDTPRPLIANRLYLPEGPSAHRVVTLKASQISSVTSSMIKVNADKIINDYSKRQQPRFR